MKKSIEIIFLPDAEHVYQYLKDLSPHKKEERMLFSSLNTKIECLKTNPHYGNPIAKELFPREYILRYAITNLFRVELSLFWRMLYTIKSSESPDSLLVFVLDILDHKMYNKKFGYSERAKYSNIPYARSLSS